MFSNIGKKIKGLAKTTFIIESILVLISSCIFFFDEDTFFIGFLMLIGGVLIAWISTWVLYGFGELVQKTTEIADTINANHSMDTLPPNGSRAENSPKKEYTLLETTAPITKIQPTQTVCQLCNNESNQLTYCKIKDNLGTRYRHICNECIVKYNATPTKE